MAVERGHIQITRVLNEEVDNVQRLASFASDGHVERRFTHILMSLNQIHYVILYIKSIIYAIDEVLSEIGAFDVRLKQLMDVFIV